MKAFLLAGGYGTRLRPVTDRIPKCLVPIRGAPLLAVWLELCHRHGIDRVLVNVARRHLDAMEMFLAQMPPSPTVTLVPEEEPRGSAGTVLANRSFVDPEESFYIIYADNLTNAPLSDMLAFHRRHSAPLTVGLFRPAQPEMCGIVELEDGGLIAGFDEKPQRPRGELANAGLYVARPSLFVEIPERAGVVDFGYDVLPRLTGRMYGYPIEEYFVDIGTHDGLARASTGWRGSH